MGAPHTTDGRGAGGGSGRRPRALFDARSERLPTGLIVRLLRWWIPGVLCAIGVVLMVADDFNTFGVSAFAAFAGAGSSTWLVNFLWRLGVSGDEDREREARDRSYLAANGRWPTNRERSYMDEHGHWPGA